MVRYTAYSILDPVNSEQARLLFCIAFANSDAFSLIYFRHDEKERFSISTNSVKKRLSKFIIDSRNVTEWPGTKIINERGHIYNMIIYKASLDAFHVIEKVHSLWDWDYPKYPMDPCFYQNGYAWLVVTAHEHSITVYLREDQLFPSVNDIESIGIHLIPIGSVPETKMFYITQCY